MRHWRQTLQPAGRLQCVLRTRQVCRAVDAELISRPACGQCPGRNLTAGIQAQVCRWMLSGFLIVPLDYISLNPFQDCRCTIFISLLSTESFRSSFTDSLIWRRYSCWLPSPRFLEQMIVTSSYPHGNSSLSGTLRTPSATNRRKSQITGLMYSSPSFRSPHASICSLLCGVYVTNEKKVGAPVG